MSWAVCATSPDVAVGVPTTSLTKSTRISNGIRKYANPPPSNKARDNAKDNVCGEGLLVPQRERKYDSKDKTLEELNSEPTKWLTCNYKMHLQNGKQTTIMLSA